MRRCVIAGGADIRRYELIRSRLRADDFFICGTVSRWGSSRI